MRVLRAAALGCVAVLVLAPLGHLSASAETLANVPVAVCADKRMFVVPLEDFDLNVKLTAGNYILNVPLSVGSGTPGFPRSADGCWRFTALLPPGGVQFSFDNWDAPGPDFAGVCYPTSLSFRLAIGVEPGQPVTLSLPTPYLVDVRTFAPSGLPVLGADVMVKGTVATASLTSAGVTTTTTFEPGSLDGWWWYGPKGTNTGRGCMSGTRTLLLADPSQPIPVFGEVTYRILDPNGTVTTLLGGVGDNDAADGVDSYLPYEVPDVVGAVPGWAGASSLMPAATSTRILSQTVSYGEPLGLDVDVSTLAEGGPAAVASAPVALSSISAYGRRTVVGTGVSGAEGSLPLSVPITRSGRYLLAGDGFSSGGTWVDVSVRPQVPQNAQGVTGAQSVALTWRKPADGGSPLTGYVVQWAPSGGVWSSPIVLPPTATSWKKTGLVTGKKYVFRLAARSIIGSSPFTPSVSAVPGMPATVPLTASPRSAAASLAWTTPSWSGGFAIKGYQVQMKRSSSTAWGSTRGLSVTSRSLLWSGLTNGTDYDFRVRAYNSVAAAPWSLPMRVKAGAPTVPRTLIAQSQIQPPQVGLSWSPPALANGSPVNAYVFQYRKRGTATWSTVIKSASTYLYMHNVLANTAYEMRVAARNSRGIGPFSAAKGATTAP